MNKKRTVRSVAQITLNVIATSFMICVLLSLLLGIMSWLVGFRSWSQFIFLLQFVAIVVFLLGLTGALSQSNLSLHDRQLVSWISNIHYSCDGFRGRLTGSCPIFGMNNFRALFLFVFP